MNNSYIYRYRPTKNILGTYKELERQEIYFAATAELNDPMEGSIVPFYKGDDTHWRFFMRQSFQYVLMKCLMKNYGGKYVPQNVIDNWQDEVMKKSSLEKIIIDLSKAEVHYMNRHIKYLLQYILIPYFYWTATSYIHTMFLASEDIAKMSKDMTDRAKMLLDDVASMGVDTFLRPEGMVAINISRLKNNIETAWNAFYFEKHPLDDNQTADLFLLPTEILQYLDNMVRPKFRVASFSKCCDSASMWSLYANAQDGVCLKFQTLRKGDKTTLEFENSAVENVYIHDVKYTENLMNLETAYNLLSFVDAHVQGIANHTEFYEANEAPYVQKLQDWEFEQEARMIIPDHGKDFSKMKYKSSSLCAIIWGSRVSFRDRYEMIDIMRPKYTTENGFKLEFYEYNANNLDWCRKPVYVLNG